MKFPLKRSYEQEERLGILAWSDKEQHLKSQVKQLPTLQRAGMINFLRTNKNLFRAIVHCRRIGAEDIFQELLKSKVLVLCVTKHLVLRRKRKTQPEKYCELHRESGLEIKTLETVLRYQYNLRGLLRKRKGQNLGKTVTSFILITWKR